MFGTISSWLSLLTGSYRNIYDGNIVFVEVEPYEKGFADHYQKHIRPLVNRFERARIRALERASFWFRSSLIVVPLIWAGGIFLLIQCKHSESEAFLKETFLKFVLTVMVGVTAGAVALIYCSIESYKKSVKKVVFPKIITFLGQYRYKPECGNKIKRFRELEIIPSYERELSEDNITGIYKDVKMEVFETALQVSRQTNHGTLYYPVFKGIIVHLGMNKNFNGKTILRKDSGAIGNWIKAKVTDLEVVSLEDLRFEGAFEVYSNSQVEARYLLTTAFMERLMKLRKHFDDKPIECCFFSSSLLIMIPVKRDLFAPSSVFEPVDFIDDCKSVLTEMNLLFQIIDTLKLDQKIGM